MRRKNWPNIAKQADFFQIGDILRLMKILVDLNGDLKSGLDERFLLEIAGVKMAELESTVQFEEVLARLNAGEARVRLRLRPTPPNQSRRPDFFPPSPLRRAATPAAAKLPLSRLLHPEMTLQYTSRAVNLPQVQAGWDSFLALLRQSHPMLASQLRMAELRVGDRQSGPAVFYASGDASRQLVQKTGKPGDVILKALRDHFRANLTVKFDIDSDAESTPSLTEEKSANAKIDPKKLIESSPRLKYVVEKVDGEIIGIKKRWNRFTGHSI